MSQSPRGCGARSGVLGCTLRWRAPGPRLDADRRHRLKAGIGANRIEVAFLVRQFFKVRLDRAGLAEQGDRTLGVPLQARVAGEVVSQEGALLAGWFGGEGPLERLDGQVEAAGALLAPAQRNPDADLAGEALAGAGEGFEGLGKAIKRTERLAAQVVYGPLRAIGLLDLIEHAKRVVGHAQFEVTFGLAQSLGSAKSNGFGHGEAPQIGDSAAGARLSSPARTAQSSASIVPWGRERRDAV